MMIYLHIDILLTLRILEDMEMNTTLRFHVFQIELQEET